MHHTFGNRNRPPAAHSNSMFLNRANFIVNGNRIFSNHKNGRKNVADKIQTIRYILGKYTIVKIHCNFLPSIILAIRREKNNEKNTFYYLIMNKGF